MREIIVMLLVIAASCAVFAVWSRVRYARLAGRRRAAGSSFETFRADLPPSTSERVPQIVYEHFSKMTRTAVPVLPSDDLGGVYGIVDDDVPDELNELADKCGVQRPTREQAYRVQTVADAVVLLGSLPRGQ